MNVLLVLQQGAVQRRDRLGRVAFAQHGFTDIVGHQQLEPVEQLAGFLTEFDQILLMTVEPGFGGQKFLDPVLAKIRSARKLIDASGADIWLQIDGGVSADTIERAAEAGADTFVAGSAVYRSDDPDQVVTSLRNQAQAAQDCCH